MSLSVASIRCSVRMIWASWAQLVGSADAPDAPSRNRETTSPTSQRFLIGTSGLSDLQGPRHDAHSASAWFTAARLPIQLSGRRGAVAVLSALRDQPPESRRHTR